MKCRLLSLVSILVLISASLAMGDDACQRLGVKGDYAGAVKACSASLASGGTAADALALAKAHRVLFEFKPMLEAYRDGVKRFGTLELYRAFTADLLAFNLEGEAASVLNEAMERYPNDANLMELKAVTLAYAGADDEACAWIRTSWAAGADPLSWAENTLFGERAFQPPYRNLLDSRLLADSLTGVDPVRQAVRLRLLAEVMKEEAAGPIVKTLLAGAAANINRLGVSALAQLNGRALPICRSC